jgi:hypothetical protein
LIHENYKNERKSKENENGESNEELDEKMNLRI